jgi:hypothetical protein
MNDIWWFCLKINLTTNYTFKEIVVHPKGVFGSKKKVKRKKVEGKNFEW